MLPGERWIHHLNPIGSIGSLYVVVKIDIGVIIQMPPSLVMLKKILVFLMILIGRMMWKKNNNMPDTMVLK